MASRRLDEIYDDFDGFLGEAVRRLITREGLGPSLRLVALAQTVGKEPLVRAVRIHLEGSPRAGPLTAAVGAAIAASGLGALSPQPVPLLGGLALGVGWLVTARRLTPLRRHFAAHLAMARGRWQRSRQAWLARQCSRSEREDEVNRLLDELVAAWATLTTGEAAQPAGEG